jgi:mandelate racemase
MQLCYAGALTSMAIPALTIRSLYTTAVTVPMKRPLGTSAQTVRTAPLLLVDLETEQGVTGRTYLYCYLPVAAGMLARALEECLVVIKGEQVEPRRIGDKLWRHFCLAGTTGVIGMALSAIDVVCWDALASAVGTSLCRFLGGQPSAIPAYNSNGLGLMPAQGAADDAEALLEGGFGGVKMRLGHADFADDLTAVRAVRKRLPRGIELMADYNQALSVEEALERGRALDGEGLAWIEEPIRHDDYAGCARLAEEVTTPIQIGENFAGPQAMAAALAANAADYMMLDAFRIGGVTGWRESAALAFRPGMRLSSHLVPELSVHLLAITPTRHWVEYVDWANPILAEPLAVTQGAMTPPERPGTGLRWDDAAVARYRVA